MRTILPTALLVSLVVLSGCSQGADRPWAEITVVNSNGNEAAITCPSDKNCKLLRAAMKGEVTATFSYEGFEKDPDNWRAKREYPLPKLSTREEDKRYWTRCFMVRYFKDELEITGQLDGREIELGIDQSNSCGRDQYILWNLIAETDPSFYDYIKSTELDY